jgi:hypothetical protein
MDLIVNDRTEVDDTRAVAVSLTRVSIDPTQVTKDLTETRSAVKDALKRLKDTPNESSPLLPLAPFTPKKTWKQLMDWALNDPDHPAILSNFGDVGSAVTAPDGTQAQAAWARGTNQHITARWLEQSGGQLQLLIGRLPTVSKISISIQAYQPNGVTTKPALREVVERTLDEFGLTGEID